MKSLLTSILLGILVLLCACDDCNDDDCPATVFCYYPTDSLGVSIYDRNNSLGFHPDSIIIMGLRLGQESFINYSVHGNEIKLSNFNFFEAIKVNYGNNVTSTFLFTDFITTSTDNECCSDYINIISCNVYHNDTLTFFQKSPTENLRVRVY